MGALISDGGSNGPGHRALRQHSYDSPQACNTRRRSWKAREVPPLTPARATRLTRLAPLEDRRRRRLEG